MSGKSTPADGSPYLSRYASSNHPFTTQHPHPVPLTNYPQSSYPKMLGSSIIDRDDFIPLTESGRTLNARREGLEMSKKEQVPMTSPAGKNKDQRRSHLPDAVDQKDGECIDVDGLDSCMLTSSHSILLSRRV